MTTLPGTPDEQPTSAAPIPDVDSLFPAKSVDELFPPEVERERYRRQTLGTSPIQDLIFGDTSVNPVARVLDHFGQGARQGWGSEPNGLSQDSVDALKRWGLFNDYDKGQRSIIKAANESLFRGAATYLVEPVMRGLPALFRGAQEAIAQIGEEAGQPQLGREAAGAFEAFPVGVRAPTGIPHAPPHPMLAEIERARDLGVIGAGEEGYFGTKAAEPTPPISAPDAVVKAAEKPVESPKAEVAPEQAAAAQTAPVESAVAPERLVQPPIDIAKDVTDKLVAAGRPAEEASASAQLIASHYEARAARFEGALGTAEDLYRAEGADIRPGQGVAPAKSEPIRPTPEPDAGAVETTGPKPTIDGGSVARPDLEAATFDTKDGSAASSAEEAAKIPNDSSLNRTASWVIRNKDTKEVVLETFDAKKVEALNTAKYEAVPIGQYLGELNKATRTAAEDGQTLPPASRAGLPENWRRGKYQDWTPGRIVKVGIVDGLKVEGVVPAEFKGDAAAFIVTKGNKVYAVTPHKGISKLEGVEAAAKLEQARASSSRELAQIKRGKIQLREDAKPVITLFKDANASTFIHETGHQWLEELIKDSEHPKAPAGLRDDAEAVRSWLGVHSLEDIKTSHHERFARGFERYMMEGKAPNQALANVFAHFRAWLTKIYETVTRLKSPINDEIRGVFDRLLTMHPSEVKIEPEGPPKTFADIHESDAKFTPPESAHPVAETIQAERDMLANEHIPEEHDARLDGIAAKADRREAGGPQPVRDGNETRTLPEEAGNDQATGEVGSGGSDVAPEGSRPSVGAGSKTEPPVSPQELFKGSDSALVDKAGNIRLDNINAPEDILQVLRDSAARNNDFLEQRRGVMTDGDALRLADAMGVDVAYLNTKKIGEAWNKEEIFGLERLLIQSATAVRDVMASGDVTAYAEAKARHLMIHDFVQGKASAARAEAGRALQAFAALKKMNGAADARELSAFLKANSDNKTLFQLEREMKLGSQLETPAQVSKFVNDSVKPTWKEMVVEAWITSLLSGPKTHMANIIGNTISGLWRPLETATAATIGKARSIVTGSQDRVLMGEAAAELFGMVQGSREGVIAAYKAFKTEEPQLTGVRQVEQGHPKALPSASVNLFGREMEIGGKQARIPLRLLGAEDEFFKSVSFRGDINRQAYAIAAKEGLAGERFNTRVAELSSSPTEEMIDHAKGVAEYQTFQQPLGKVGRSVQNFANSHILAKFVVPFVRTPINLLKYANERTPLGLFAQEVRDNLSGKNGAVARDTQIARITLGTMVGIATYELASQGLITGGGPVDSKKRAVMQANGWQDYSVRIGDMYYRYNRLDPFSVILGVVADAYEIQQAGGSDHADKEHLPALVFGAITKNILNRASLSGASDLIQAVSDPERYGKNYIKGMIGTVVPAISAQTAQTIDPVVREARTVLDGLKARIPGLSQGLLPRRDIWGEPVVRDGGAGPDIMSPIMEKRIKDDPVNKALLSANYFPAKLDRKIRGVELTDQQYDDYQRLAGRMAKMRLNAMVNIIGNPNVPAAARQEVIQTTIKSAREAAQSLIIMQSVKTDNDIMKKASDAKLAKYREAAH